MKKLRKDKAPKRPARKRPTSPAASYIPDRGHLISEYARTRHQ